jgi:hypothetical protein
MKVFYYIFSLVPIMSSSSSIPYISEDRDNSGIPVTCSKCNETFQTDSDYVIRYNQRHAEILLQSRHMLLSKPIQMI